MPIASSIPSLSAQMNNAFSAMANEIRHLREEIQELREETTANKKALLKETREREDSLREERRAWQDALNDQCPPKPQSSRKRRASSQNSPMYNLAGLVGSQHGSTSSLVLSPPPQALSSRVSIDSLDGRFQSTGLQSSHEFILSQEQIDAWTRGFDER